MRTKIINILKKIKPENDLKLIFTVSLLSRLLLVAFMIFAVGNQTGLFERAGRALIHWDGAWYTDIAANGYDADYSDLSPDHVLCNSGTGFCQRNFAFFPVYPALVRALGEILGNLNLAAVLISNAAFVLAAMLLFKFAKSLFGRRTAYYSILALWLWPAGYVFSAAMTESLFLLLLLAVYYSFYYKKYLIAGILGALISATRNTGILVLLPMALILLEQSGYRLTLKKLNLKIVAGFLLVSFGLLLFMIYLNFRTGDPFAFINIQEYWDKPVLGLTPLYALYLSLFDYRLEGGITVHLYNLVYLAGIISLFFWSHLKKVLPFSLNVVLLFILVPMTAGTLLSLSRYTAVLFPVYLLLGNIAKKHEKLMLFVYLGFFVLLIALSYLYARGHWITV